ATVQALVGKGNVVAIDLLNEALGWYGGDPAALYAACRAVTALPLTYSGVPLLFTDPPTSASLAYLACCDFLDIHLYPATGGDVAALRTQYPAKEILVGEYGSPAAAGQAGQAAWYQSCLALL